MRRQHPSFVAVPVTPAPPIWAHPDARYGTQENLGYVEELVGELLQKHPIDENRIYIIGCSIGGTGAFGAIARYPDLFAAGIAISGYWKTIDAPIMINTPCSSFTAQKIPFLIPHTPARWRRPLKKRRSPRYLPRDKEFRT